jgi:hypothetical protein
MLPSRKKNQEPIQEDSSIFVPTTTQEDTKPSEPIVYVRRSSRTVKPHNGSHFF